MILTCNNKDILPYIFQNIFDISACVCIYLTVLDFTLQFIYNVNGALISFQIYKILMYVLFNTYYPKNLNKCTWQQRKNSLNFYIFKKFVDLDVCLYLKWSKYSWKNFGYHYLNKAYQNESYLELSKQKHDYLGAVILHIWYSFFTHT